MNPLKELTAGLPIAQAQVIAKGPLLEATLLAAGPSRNGTYYPVATLQEAAPRFAGVRCYCDHDPDTPAGQRSVADLAGRVEEAWFEGDRIRGRIRLSATQGTLATLVAEGLAGDLSITALGTARLAKEGDRLYRVVERIHTPLSVDFVTEAAAGGRIERILRESVAWNRALELLEEELEWPAEQKQREATLRWLLG
ncbi:MAG TPA: hypothetical protein VEI97_11745 [bacterium]|nr:hypothetical protein [bacterium]